MRQRVKLAQELVHEPDVLFLDEPMTGLDPIGRLAIFELIRDLGRGGKTVVVSSHILYEIENVTSNIILMNQGTVLAVGDVHDVPPVPIDAHPHSVSVRCNAPRALAAKIIDLPAIVTVEFDDDISGLVVRTRDPNAFYARLTELLADPIRYRKRARARR